MPGYGPTSTGYGKSGGHYGDLAAAGGNTWFGAATLSGQSTVTAVATATEAGVALPVLDDFNRADNTTLGTNWAGASPDSSSVGSTVGISANRAYPSSSGVMSNVWNTSFAEDQEVYVTVQDAQAAEGIRLYARATGEGTPSRNGYRLTVFQSGGATDWVLVRIATGAAVVSLSGQPAVNDGDKIRFTLEGANLKAYHKTSSGWATRINTTDATPITGGGKIGIGFTSNTTPWYVDDFGGGHLPTLLNGAANFSGQSGLTAAAVRTLGGAAGFDGESEIRGASFFDDSMTGTALTNLLLHSPEKGGAWLKTTGYADVIQLDGFGTAYATGSTNLARYYNDVSPPSANYAVQLLVEPFTLLGFLEVSLRQVVPADQHYYVRVNPTTITLGRRNGGVDTPLGTYTFSGDAPTVGNAFTLSIRAEGNVIRAYYGNQRVIQVTDSTYTGAGKPSISIRDGGASTGYHVNQITAYPLGVDASAGNAGGATLTGESGMVASGSVVQSASAAFAGQSSLTAVAGSLFAGVATFTGQSSVTSTGKAIFAGATTFLGESTFTAAATKYLLGAVALSGESSLSATSMGIRLAAVSLSGQSDLSASGGLLALAAASFSGQSSFTAAGVRQALAATTLSGESTLSANSITRMAGAAALLGQSNLAASTGGNVLLGAAILTAESSLTTAALRIANGAASFSAQASLSATGMNLALAVAILGGESETIVTALRTTFAQLLLGGDSEVIATAEANVEIHLDGQSGLVIAGARIIQGDPHEGYLVLKPREGVVA